MMMKRIAVTIFTLLLTISLTARGYADDIASKSGKFIESFEWDETVYSNIESFRSNEKAYINYLQSSDDKLVFVGSVMLGLLKANQAGQILRTLKPKGKLSEIGIAFALCSLRLDYNENYSKLEKIGREHQMAGRARSLKYLEVAELLSFLPDKKFTKYATSVITDEEFQHEAIAVALDRFKLMHK